MNTPKTVWELIQVITPLYNSYTQNSNNIKWTDALEIMREIWSILSDFIEKNSVAPHNLYRQIYWKWEWTTNVEQKSYITREFLWRCYRIYKMFSKKENIRKQLPTLASFTAFREAMPFFDNPKYKLSWEDMQKLLILLNSSDPKSKIINTVRILQKKYIWIKNPRTQRLNELDKLKQSFVDLYKHVKLLLEWSYSDIEKELIENGLTKDDIKKISANINALTDDSFKMNLIYPKWSISEPWLSSIDSINEIAVEKTAQKRRRVRKIIDPMILVHIADMVTALSSEEYFKNYVGKNW